MLSILVIHGVVGIVNDSSRLDLTADVGYVGRVRVAYKVLRRHRVSWLGG